MDADGINKSNEVNKLSVNPSNNDTDADRINDNYELNALKSDLTNTELAETVILIIIEGNKDSNL